MAETQPWFLQGLCYQAEEFRAEENAHVCGEGVVDVAGGDLLVTTGASGLNLFVAAGEAYVLDDHAGATSTGMYRVLNDGQVTLTATTASGANPRVDTVVATVRDAEYGGTDNDWILQIVAGTPNAAAALTDAGITASAAAVPAASVVLAYVLVPTSFAGPFVNATHILDARNNYFKCGSAPWASIEAAAATSSANASVTQTTLATLVHRDRDFFSITGSTITVLQAGIYDINALVGFAAITSAGTNRFATIYKNNTNLPNAAPDGQIIARAGATNDSGEASVSEQWTPTRSQIMLAANDTLKMGTLQDTGGAVNTFHSAGVFVAHLTVRKVG